MGDCLSHAAVGQPCRRINTTKRDAVSRDSNTMMLPAVDSSLANSTTLRHAIDLTTQSNTVTHTTTDPTTHTQPITHTTLSLIHI